MSGKLDKIKEANRLMWMVKGMLIPETWSLKDIDWVLDSYTKRLWYREEASDEGFEEAWRKRNGVI